MPAIDLERLVLLPSTADLSARAEAARKAAETGRAQNRVDAFGRLRTDLERAERDLADGLKRDAMRAERPVDCWCLGLGGKHEVYTVDGIRGFREWCTCPEALEMRRQFQETRRKKNEERELQRVEKGWEESQIPKRFSKFRLESSPVARKSKRIMETLRYPAFPDCEPPSPEWEAFSEAESRWLGSIFLWGEFGRGKTGLAVGYAWEFLVKHGDDLSTWTPVLFRSAPDLFSELRDTYRGQGKSEEDLLKRYGTVPLLILDDLGAEHVKDSGWLEDRLYQIIGRRHGEELTTVFTSNLSLEALAAKIGERVTWRIVEMCGADRIIKIEGPNLRDR